MLAYAERHQFGWRLLAPHLAVVSCLLASLVIACLLIARTRLPSAARRTLLVAVLAGGHAMLMTCYLLFFVSWEAWDQAASFAVVAAYLPQLPQLLQALPVSGALVAGVCALALVLVLIPYALVSATLLRSFEWAVGMLSARYGSWTRVWRVTVLVTAVLACPTLLMQAAGAGAAVAVRMNEPFFQAALGPGREVETMRLDPMAVVRAQREREVARNYQPPPAIRKKNLFIITVDALRADRTSVYGAVRDTTPFLRRLHDEGSLTRIDNAFSTCTESICGMLGILSSRYWHQASLRSFGLADVLKRIGFQVSFLNSGDHTNFYGLRAALGASMDLYRDGSTTAGYANDDANVLEWLARLQPAAGVPQFAYIHLMSAHTLGSRRKEFQKWQPSKLDVFSLRAADYAPLVNYYDNGVLQADAMIERIFAQLRRKGLLQNSVVVITADHGELLGENGQVGHGRFAPVNELVRVPLLIYDAERYGYPRRAVASVIDVAPTLLHRIGAPAPGSWVGEALGVASKRQAVVMQSRLGRALVGRFEGTLWKYVDGGNAQSQRLFDIARDPLELDDRLLHVDRGQVAHIRAVLRTAFGEAGGSAVPWLGGGH